jgi:magnesium-dependent phosphatase 1
VIVRFETNLRDKCEVLMTRIRFQKLSHPVALLDSHKRYSMALLPKVIAFDLDGTLWSPEMYELWGGGAPFTAHRGGEYVTDRKGERVNLLGTSRQVLEELCSTEAYKKGEFTIAYVSTCDEPAWARECLTKITLHGGKLTMSEAASVHEIYKARDKTVHFAAVHKKTGVAYEDMIFFDNQTNNIRDVTPIGVHCVYCPDGITDEIWRRGITEFNSKAKRRGV